MQLLHPYYLIPAILFLLLSFWEVYSDRKVSKIFIHCIAAWFILVVGFRSAGADYGSYQNIYYSHGQFTPYSEIFKKALFLKNNLDLEWLYVLFNKVVYDFLQAPPYFVFTFLLALIMIPLYYMNIWSNSLYPYTTIIYFYFPSFFIGENGQVRQELAMILCYLAIRFIKKRQIFKYMIMMYLAMGIHSSAIFFVPMYWLARVPINKSLMVTLIILCAALSPFRVYEYFGSFLTSIANDSSVTIAYSGYLDKTVDQTQRLNGGFGIPEGIVLILITILFSFDTRLKKYYPYYEYMRNYIVIGICFYFIFRDNIMFSNRLTGLFISAAGFFVTYPLYVLGKDKWIMHTFLVALFLFFFLVFSNFQVATFSIDNYYNYLLP